jgi:hypothetical protein
MSSGQQSVKAVAKRWTEFLESTPPYTTEVIADLFKQSRSGAGSVHQAINSSDVYLHCDNKVCQGSRFFAPTNEPWLRGGWCYHFLTYVCRNCQRNQRVYALALKIDDQPPGGEAVKLGELPAFGPPTPSRVIALIGPDRDLFLSGRRAENLGFGIGAFAYYRRVVENQKGRIIKEIAKAAERLGAKEDALSELEKAAKETQFSRAVDQIKSGIPTALLIDGHNPLTLLHTALSEGLHEHTEQECLEIAQGIRLVLTELAERISQALKEEAELKKAVSRLLNRKKLIVPETK